MSLLPVTMGDVCPGLNSPAGLLWFGETKVIYFIKFSKKMPLTFHEMLQT